MRILIVNDDSISSPVLKPLALWAQRLGEVTVAVPKLEQSGKSHGIELHKAFEVMKVEFAEGIEAYTVDSTPADCVRFGIVGLEREYDLVLSGINKGVNVGVDLVYSGTVAAIFEAARLGHRGIAFSTFPHSQEAASKHFQSVYEFITGKDLFSKNLIFNVNIPDEVVGMHLTYQGSPYFSDTFVKGEGDMYIQAGCKIEDVCPDDLKRDTVAIHKGYISVTPLLSTRTNMSVVEEG